MRARALVGARTCAFAPEGGGASIVIRVTPTARARDMLASVGWCDVTRARSRSEISTRDALYISRVNASMRCAVRASPDDVDVDAREPIRFDSIASNPRSIEGHVTAS